jgi:uncharacterized protein (TIGR03067 family)
MDELQDWQGAWQTVWWAEDGRKLPSEGFRQSQLTISGERFTLCLGGYDLHGTIRRVDSARNRGAVDFVADESEEGRTVFRGVYVLADDELSICVALPGRDRPTSFAAQRGSGQSLYLLRRDVSSAALA